MEEIKAHPWLNASSASPSEVNQHFLSLKTLCKMDENEKELELSKYIAEGYTARGHGDSEGLDADQKEELDDLIIEMNKN